MIIENVKNKVGKCMQCDAQILVRDMSGKFTIRKVTFKEVKLFFDNGVWIRVALCQKCVTDSNIALIMTNLKESGMKLPKRDDLPTKLVVEGRI